VAFKYYNRESIERDHECAKKGQEEANHLETFSYSKWLQYPALDFKLRVFFPICQEGGSTALLVHLSPVFGEDSTTLHVDIATATSAAGTSDFLNVVDEVGAVDHDVLRTLPARHRQQSLSHC